MKSLKFVAVLALVAVAAADVSHLGKSSPEATADILQYSSDVQPDKYAYSVQTSNGISAQESGVLKNTGKDEESISVQGSNQHTGPDGVLYQIDYTADEFGYHPQGAHLPTPPPTQAIPDDIRRALEYIAAHPAKPEDIRRS